MIASPCNFSGIWDYYLFSILVYGAQKILQDNLAKPISRRHFGMSGNRRTTRTSYMFMSAPPQKTSSEQQNSVRTCKGPFHDLGAPIGDCKGNLGLPDGFLQVQC